MDEMHQLQQRVRRLEATEAIRQLVARYAFVTDDRDIDGLRALFTQDACFRYGNGTMEVRGIDAVIDVYHARFAGMQHAFHAAHDHLIEFQSDQLATGRVSSHAEVTRNGEPHIVALRYDDVYALEEGAWRFRERAMSFYYYVRIADYAQVMKTSERVCSPGMESGADWPEATPSFIAYLESHRSG